jgi:hypothetical protein
MLVLVQHLSDVAVSAAFLSSMVACRGCVDCMWPWTGMGVI